jgi:hypothetical protein
MSRVSQFEHYVAPRAGYGGNPDPKTDYCSVCEKRRPVRSFRVKWRGGPVCKDCEGSVRLVTFRAAWTELLPREKAEAVAEGDDLTEVAVDRLWVTRVEERMPSVGHPRPADQAVLTVHLADTPPPGPS